MYRLQGTISDIVIDGACHPSSTFIVEDKVLVFNLWRDEHSSTSYDPACISVATLGEVNICCDILRVDRTVHVLF